MPREAFPSCRFQDRSYSDLYGIAEDQHSPLQHYTQASVSESHRYGRHNHCQQLLQQGCSIKFQLDCSQQILQSDKSQPTRRHRKLNHHIEMFLHTKCALLARSAWHLRPTECRNKHITMAQCWLHVLVARTDIWSLIISKYVVNNPFQSWSYALTDSRSSPTIASLWKTYWNKMVSFSSGVLSAQMGMLKFGKMGSQPENHHLWKARNLYG